MWNTESNFKDPVFPFSEEYSQRGIEYFNVPAKEL